MEPGGVYRTSSLEPTAFLGYSPLTISNEKVRWHMYFPVLFSVYWIAVLAWCLMAARLCRTLSERHPLLYDTLGRPALLATGQGMESEIALLRFLLRRRDRFMEDRKLARLCGAMRGLFIVYLLFFLTLPALLIQR